MGEPLLCIMGPTASGKTRLAIDLAQALNGELVSVDSALVYRGLDIGSAKPDYPHHLVDICDPADAYSAARFADDARRAIDEIRTRGRRPILVGGTMLYFRALVQGLAPLPSADPALRAALQAEAREHGWPALHAQLQQVDPVSAARIHPNHSQRLSRALEVYRLTGQPLSRLHLEGRGAGLEEEILAVALAPRDRSVLHERIRQRFDQMLEAGFLDEVATLRAREDLRPELPALRAVGYRQLWAHLDGECSMEEARQAGIIATRQLAKRQFTWLRKWPGLHWLLTDSEGRVTKDGLRSPGDGSVPSDPGDADGYPTPSNVLLNYLRCGPMV